MVLKEELCAWFKDLQPRKRIDYMCGLLDMCLPLELRFIGTVLEDLAKKDFNYLRDAEMKANRSSHLESLNENDSERTQGKSFGLMNEVFRAKIHVYLALLHSNNTTCANVIFNLLERQFDYIISSSHLHNKKILEHVCSIFTLACHHPAFQFYQRSYLGEVLKVVEARVQHSMDDSEAHLNLSLPPPIAARVGFPSLPLCNRPPVYDQYEKARIRSIQVKGHKSKDEQQNKKGALLYDVHTTWSTGEVTQVYMKYKEFQDIHHKLVNKFPEWPSHSVPELPAYRKYKEEQRDGLANLTAYLTELVKAPAYVVESDILIQPLRNGKAVQQAVALGNLAALPFHSNFHGVPIYPGGALIECKYSPDALRIPPYTYQYPSNTVAATSPRTSLLSSSTNSPNNSRSSSPISNAKSGNGSGQRKNSVGGNRGVQLTMMGEEPTHPVVEPVIQLLRLCDLEKYSDNLSCYSFDQLLVMSKEELGKAGLPSEAQVKLRSKLDQLKEAKGREAKSRVMRQSTVLSHNPQEVNGLIELPPGYTASPPPDSQVMLAHHPHPHHYPVLLHPSQEAALLNSGQPSPSHSPSATHQPPYNLHQPHPPVSSSSSSSTSSSSSSTSLASPPQQQQPSPHTTSVGESSSPANSEVCSPSLSPALQPSDSPQSSPVSAVARGGGLPPTAVALSQVNKSGHLQGDSSSSEDDRVPGADGPEPVIGVSQVAGGYLHSQQLQQLPNSLPLISQQPSCPPGFVEKKIAVMPAAVMEGNGGSAGHPGGIIPVSSVAVTLVNGFLPDAGSPFLPPAGGNNSGVPAVIPPQHILGGGNARAAFKHAQPTHTAPGRHQNVVNMPGLDLGSPSSSSPQHHQQQPGGALPLQQQQQPPIALHHQQHHHPHHQGMSKGNNGNANGGSGLNGPPHPVMPQVLHHPHAYMVPPPMAGTQGGANPGGHPSFQAVNSNNNGNPAATNQSMPAGETGGPNGNGNTNGGAGAHPPTMVPLVYMAHHPNLAAALPPQHRGILNTMANSSVVITTTQSHHHHHPAANSNPNPPPPAALPASHSPSPVAAIIASEQQQILPLVGMAGGGGLAGGYVSSGNGNSSETPSMDSSSSGGRQEGSPTSPPNHAALVKAAAGAHPSSGTPSPPLLLSNKQQGNVNCDSSAGAPAPSVFIPHQMQPYVIPIHGHSNGLVTPMPPPYPFSHASNPGFPNGFNPEMYSYHHQHHHQHQHQHHRFPAHLGGGQVPFHLYGNSIYNPHQMHSQANNNNNGGMSNIIGGGSTSGSNSKSGCYNCGQMGHKSVDCKEPPMDSLTKPFSLNLNPSPKGDPE